jgi:hypothetical protein
MTLTMQWIEWVVAECAAHPRRRIVGVYSRTQGVIRVENVGPLDPDGVTFVAGDGGFRLDHHDITGFVIIDEFEPVDERLLGL